MTQEEAVFLAKRDIVDIIYSSARIEGIGVTYPDTNEIIEGRVVAGLSVDDVLKINNLKHAWRFVLDDIQRAVDLQYIKDLHSVLGSHEVVNAGLLRHADVYIGGTDWKPEKPDEARATEDIAKIVRIEPCVDSALSMFCYLCRAQLFYDGNKRLAQLAANKILIEGGVGVLRIPDNDQKEFLHLLIAYYESGDSSQLKQLLRERAIRTQQFS